MKSTTQLLMRLVPASFMVGAGIEAFMIYVPVGGQTFYDVAKRKKAERLAEELLEQERLAKESVERKKRLREKYSTEQIQ